jgi:hypothetical protein
MKQAYIKLGNKLLFPLILLGSISFVFDKELANFPFITLIRIIILIMAIIVVSGGIVQLIDINKK